jgi:hypothetical protein
VNARLIEILKGPDDAASTAAAVEPLSQTIVSENQRLAMASIRGLGRIGTAEAHAVLESADTSHPNASVRRRAEAELRVLDAKSRDSR